MNGPNINPEMDEGIPRCSGKECPLFDTIECGGEIGNVCEAALKSMLPENLASALVVTFTAPGSAEFSLKSIGLVSPGQLASLGQSLISRVDFVIKAAMQEQMQAQVHGPGPGIIAPGMDPRMVAEILKGMPPL